MRVIVVSNSAEAPDATVNVCEPMTPAGPLSVTVMSSARSLQLCAKPLRRIGVLLQAEPGAEQLTLSTQGGVLHSVEQELVPGALVPHELVAVADTFHCVGWPGVQSKVKVVSNSAVPPAGMLGKVWLPPLIEIVMSAARSPQLSAKPLTVI